MPKEKCVLVAEDDPDWLRFWAAHPWHIKKLDARKAWAQLQPSPEIVDAIMSALAWQVPLWKRQGFGLCYPSSYLRGRRWEDERVLPRTQSIDDVRWWQATCPHQPLCGTARECNVLKYGK